MLKYSIAALALKLNAKKIAARKALEQNDSTDLEFMTMGTYLNKSNVKKNQKFEKNDSADQEFVSRRALEENNSADLEFFAVELTGNEVGFDITMKGEKAIYE